MLIRKLEKLLSSKIGKNFTEKKYLLAVSGGLDSVVLFHVMRKLVPSRQLVVAHFNHKTRQESSEKEARSVILLAKKYKIKSVLGVYSGTRKTETELRKSRLAFLKNTQSKLKLDYILTAHHAQDQLETVLMRLVRGTGIKGMAGMKLKNGIYIKPFLFVSRTDVLNFAKKNNIKWREDYSNQEDIYFRNRIRKYIIPVILKECISYGGEEKFYKRLRGLHEECHQIIRTQVKTAKIFIKESVVSTALGIRFELEKFTALPKTIQRVSLLEIYYKLTKESLTRPWTEKIIQSLIEKKALSIPGKVELRVSCGVAYFGIDAVNLVWTVKENTHQCESLGVKIVLDSQYTKTREIRFFKDGDRFQGKKLKKLFLEAKIPTPERHLLPLLAKKESSSVEWIYPMKVQGVCAASCSFPFFNAERLLTVLS